MGERRRNYLKYRPSGAGSKRGRGGWGAPARWLKKGALTSRQQPSRARIQELGERSASAPRVCMRRRSKTANSACECRTANARRARR
eukprot:6197833-Pleurochrysis_carterae.AAC.5